MLPLVDLEIVIQRIIESADVLGRVHVQCSLADLRHYRIAPFGGEPITPCRLVDQLRQYKGLADTPVQIEVSFREAAEIVVQVLVTPLAEL